ncbi:hypothetical protein BEP19_15935 [Ammoniphilus oxalaticus]|uniref:Uncharacterized protein n=1 Tax=Ammoniphilus oxalaticus TaxID=66863 RepID=A0A419SQJ5_9BACL|nr:hypothetical protein [Ammoniphilus oxalaticus]RKD26695.1 hypothetical protein BEP19_15935 [Ammoniphilus oxalaticus]
MKKLLFTFMMSAILLVACGETEESTTDPVDEVANNEVEETTVEEPESNEVDGSWDDLKEMDKIVGKSDKDYSDITKSKPSNVRNDNTGNWRKSTIADSVDIEEYALSYHDLHMEEDEIHFIVNFSRNTTTVVNKLSGLLYVDIKEYVDKEEHDAKKLGSGMLLGSYVIYPDGDIQEIEIN